MLLSAGSDCIPFPLTLTLSLGEREHLVGVVTFASGRPANPAQVLANKRRRILPLPWGTAIELSELRQDRSADFSPLPAVLAGPERGGLKSALLNSMGVLPWGEGEPFSPRRTIQTRRLSTVRCALFPLPEGEGQGEGKRCEPA